MIIFIISHGQADVERGFSINANVIDVNMKETDYTLRSYAEAYLQPAKLKLPTC